MRTKPSADGPNSGKPAARQQRSLRTEAKLLAAAARVLGRDGFDAATIPRIAAEARLSPAGIYRRFADKDDLLRAALLRGLEAAAAEQPRLAPPSEDLAEAVERLITALLKEARDHPQRLRAVTRMLEAAPASDFAREAARLWAVRVAHAAGLLLAHRDSIRHPDPERAARFAVLSTISAIESAAQDHASLWRPALPLGDKAFAAELTRQALAYLRRKP